jgi:hypothetical protein
MSMSVSWWGKWVGRLRGCWGSGVFGLGRKGKGKGGTWGGGERVEVEVGVGVGVGGRIGIVECHVFFVVGQRVVVG